MTRGTYHIRLLRWLIVALFISSLAVSANVASNTNNPKPFPGSAYTSQVVIQQQTLDGVTQYASRYLASLGDCTIIWIAYDTELDRGVVKHQSDCVVSLAEQLPLLQRICASFLSKDKNAPAFRTLFWGTLSPENVTGPWDMSYRLAIAAFHSPKWDKTSGKPKHGDLNGFTKELANQVPIYPELQELFATFNRTITLSHIEKVLVMNAGQLPYFSKLKTLGVKTSDRLPFDGLSWFTITAEALD